MNEHTPYYKEKLIQGLEFQDFVCKQLCKKMGIVLSNYSSTKNQYEKGENIQGIEIKLDREFQHTGNMYFEIAEKTNEKNPSYIESGVYRSDNSWLFIIGDYSVLYIFSIKYLRMMLDNPKYKCRKITIPTSIGYLMPMEEVKKWCLKRIELGEIDDPSPFLAVQKKKSIP